MTTVGNFASRSPPQGELLKDAQRRMADITFDRDHTLDLGGVRVKFILCSPRSVAALHGLLCRRQPR
jgi:hypothetical protein